MPTEVPGDDPGDVEGSSDFRDIEELDDPEDLADVGVGDRNEVEDAGGEPDGSADPEAIRRREAEIRKRLLDIEAALNRIGVSGLPYAPRDPNRVGSPLDAPRLRAEQESLRDELRRLAESAARSGSRRR